MKNSIILFIVLPFLWFLTTNLIKTNSKPHFGNPSLCLEIDGKILFDNTEPENKCKIALICNDIIIDSLVLNEGKRKFKFTLKKNLFYSLRICKSGYITKVICIDTKVPYFENDGEDLYKFKFSTKLLKTELSSKLNKDLLDLPIAIISYNYKLEKFIYDKKYTSSIKKQMLLKR